MAQFIPTPEDVRDRPRFADTLSALFLINARNGDSATTQGYSSSDDGGGNEYIYDESSTDTINGGTVMPGYLGTLTRDSNGQFTGTAGTGRWKAKNQQVITMRQFGANADGATNDHESFMAAISSGVSVLDWEGLEYFFDMVSADNYITVAPAWLRPTANITLRGNGATIRSAELSTRPMWYLSAPSEYKTLAADVDLFSTTAEFTDASTVEQGDVIQIKSNVVAIDHGNTTAQDCRKVASVSGSTVTFQSRCFFDYLTATDTLTVEHFKAVRWTLEGMKFLCEGNGFGTALLIDTRGMQLIVKNCEWEQIGDTSITDLIGIGSLWGVEHEFRDCSFANMQEGIRINGGRRSLCTNLVFRNCNQGVLPGAMLDELTVSNVVGFDCSSLIDSHEAISVTIKNVTSLNQIQSRFNLRCVNPRIENVYIHTQGDTLNNMWIGVNTATNYARWPHFSDAQCYMSNVHILDCKSDGLTGGQYSCKFSFMKSKVEIHSCTLPSVFFEPAGIYDGITTADILISDSRLGHLHLRGHGQKKYADTLSVSGDGTVTTTGTVLSGKTIPITVAGSFGGGTISVQLDTGSGYVEQLSFTEAGVDELTFVANSKVRLVTTGSTSPSVTVDFIDHLAGTCRVRNVTFDRNLVNSATDLYALALSTPNSTTFENCNFVNYDSGVHYVLGQDATFKYDQPNQFINTRIVGFKDWMDPSLAFDPPQSNVIFRNSHLELKQNTNAAIPLSQTYYCTGTIPTEDTALTLRLNGDGDLDGSDDALDYTGNGNDGTWNGTPAYVAGPTGAETSAFRFDGTNYITTPNAGGADKTNQLTISMRAKYDDYSLLQRLCSNASGSNGFDWCIQGGIMRLFDGDAGQNYQSGSLVLTADTWVHLCVVINGSQSKFYVNGLQSGDTFSPTFTASSADFHWGRDADSASSFLTDCSVYDIRVFERALSDNEVLNALYIVQDELTEANAEVAKQSLSQPLSPNLYNADGVLSRPTSVLLGPSSILFSGDGNHELLIDPANGVSKLTADTHSLNISSSGSGLEVLATGEVITRASASEELTALSGTSATTTNLIPAGAKLLGVVARVTTLITSGDGGTDFNIGDSGDSNRYGDSIAFAADTTVDESDYTADPAGTWSASARDIVVTCAASGVEGGETFSAGAIRITAFYETFTAPTS
jgi:hypothetical protein